MLATSALRLRVAPRTSGITQNAHENEQPSWIFTNARTRSSRASACTQAIAPTSPATVSTACSIWPGTTVTFAGQPGERGLGEPGAAAGHVDAGMRAGSAGRSLPRLREALVRDAARVHDGDVTGALDLVVAVADEPLAQRLGVGLGHLAAEKTDGEARHRAENLLTDVQIRRPAARLDAALAAVAVELRLVGDEVAGGDRAARAEPRPERDDRLGGDVREREVGRGRSSSRRSACSTSTATPLSAAFRSVASTAWGSKSNARTGAKPSFAAAIERTPEPQPTSSTLPAPRPRAAAGRAASSDARRCRTRGPGRSRPRARPGRAAPRAGRSRASRRGPACGTGASGPASPPRRPTRRRRRRPARSAPRRRRSCTRPARARRRRRRAPRSPRGRARA